MDSLKRENEKHVSFIDSLSKWFFSSTLQESHVVNHDREWHRIPKQPPSTTSSPSSSCYTLDDDSSSTPPLPATNPSPPLEPLPVPSSEPGTQNRLSSLFYDCQELPDALYSPVLSPSVSHPHDIANIEKDDLGRRMIPLLSASAPTDSQSNLQSHRFRYSSLSFLQTFRRMSFASWTSEHPIDDPNDDALASSSVQPASSLCVTASHKKEQSIAPVLEPSKSIPSHTLYALRPTVSVTRKKPVTIRLPTAIYQSVCLIPHAQQLYDWDCGLACVAMVLQSIGIKRSSVWDMIYAVEPLKSIWSIDLAYLLQKYGIQDFTYYTSHIGVNYKHSSYSFYQDSLSVDQSRVHSLFARSKEAGIRIVPLRLELDDVKRFLYCDPSQDASVQYAAIVLVRLGSLRCKWCRAIESKRRLFKSKKLEQQNGSVVMKKQRSNPFKMAFCCFPLSTGSCMASKKNASEEFEGHYILVVGYDPEQDVFYYRDPGFEEELCCMEAAVLDKARNDSGTDHDTIVVRIHSL